MGYENNRKYVSTSTTRATSGNARYSVRLGRSEEHTSELQSQSNLVCRLLLEKKKKKEAHTDSLHLSSDGGWHQTIEQKALLLRLVREGLFGLGADVHLNSATTIIVCLSIHDT